jgi:hypothetical protein
MQATTVFAIEISASGYPAARYQVDAYSMGDAREEALRQYSRAFGVNIFNETLRLSGNAVSAASHPGSFWGRLRPQR